MIGDILVKISQREPLSLYEKREIELWGAKRDESNKYLFSIQDGTGNINVNRVDCVSGLFRFQPYGLSSKIRFSASVPDSVSTNATFTEILYDEIGGASISSAIFNSKEYAWYGIDIFCNWQQASGGIRRCFISSAQSETLHSSLSAPITNHLWDIRRFSPPNLTVKLQQTSGGTLSCTGTLRVQLLDKSPAFVD